MWDSQMQEASYCGAAWTQASVAPALIRLITYCVTDIL